VSNLVINNQKVRIFRFIKHYSPHWIVFSVRIGLVAHGNQRSSVLVDESDQIMSILGQIDKNGQGLRGQLLGPFMVREMGFNKPMEYEIEYHSYYLTYLSSISRSN
jgi:hypothetical protein